MTLPDKVHAQIADGALPTIGTKRVVDETPTVLRRAILSGDLQPGQKLSVPALAARLGVSRSPRA